MKRLLMVAFHFPPMIGSSGIQRTLRFARHLPELGWEPLILTAHPRAYEQVSENLLREVPRECVVERAFALDSARHLALGGRYPAFVARPDRWLSWWLGAVPKGLAMVRKYRPQAIWSTYPIATAHKIAHALQHLTGLPWIADFRDPMAQDGYPTDPKTWRSFERIERRALDKARFSVFVTPGAAEEYKKRYPDAKQRVTVIENGYDEESFATLGTEPLTPLVPGTFTLIHSGIVYPKERDPTQLFRALRSMLDTGSLKRGELRVRLRASANEAALTELIASHALEEVVELSPPIPYREALQEMTRADGLLVLQASNCNAQIPAKAYEYVRCRKPILALTDLAGDTAGFVRRAGFRHIAPLDSAEEIALVLRRFLDDVAAGQTGGPDEATIAAFSRQHRAADLARLLDGIQGSGQ